LPLLQVCRLLPPIRLNSKDHMAWEAQSTVKHSNLSTIGFAMGFVLMMVLDVVMG